MRRLLILLIFFTCLKAEVTVLSGVTVERRGTDYVVSIKTSAPVASYRAFLLDGPPRLVIDISGAKKAMPSSRGINNPFIKGIRSSQFSPAPPVVRIVLDLKEKIRFKRAPGTSLTFILSSKHKTVKRVCDPGKRQVLNMVFVPDGTFSMGSDDYFDEQPVRQVRMKGFWISRCEVTNREYARFLNDYGDDVDPDGNKMVHFTDRPGLRFAGDSVMVDYDYDHFPVMNVTWYGAAMFCRFYGYRLPTEAEWEYACRGGTSTCFYCGDSAACLDRYAWYAGNTGYEAKPVGGKDYNRYGLYDMHGNLWEWCADWYSENAYRDGPADNPLGPTVGAKKILRGGAWSSDPKDLRCANRNRDYPVEANITYGFRCVAESEPTP